MAEAFLYGNKKEKTGSKVIVKVNPATNSIDNIGLVASASKGDLTYESDVKTNGQTVFRNLENGDWTFQVRKGNTKLSHDLSLNDTYEVRIGLFSCTFQITYPEGSVCKIYKEDGSLTFTAPNTNGYWECVIPETGNWIIEATDGTNIKSSLWNVREDNDGYNLTDELKYDLYLFRPNDSCEDVTGGWSIDDTGNEKVTYGEVLTITSVNYYNYSRGEGIYTNNTIDLTNYNTLLATCYATGGSEQQVVISDQGIAEASVSIGTTLNTVTLDISKFSGPYKIGFHAYHSNYATVTYTASEIKLIP